MKLQIEKTTKTTETVDLPIPCFFRNKAETWYVGLLDEKTTVEIRKDQFETTIRNYNNEMWNAGKSAVEYAYNNFYSCTESEFIQAFDDAVEALSLHPKLVS